VVPSLTPAEARALDDLVASVRALLGAELVELRLFGSRARGEGHQDSDLDIAVVVTEPGLARRRDVHDAAFDIGLEHGVSLAPLVLSQRRLDELRARERLLAADLDREGIVL